MEWRNIYRGMLMGASDVVPGVSGGTIAVLLGIYDRLIEAISGVFSKDWKKYIGFLIPLGIGVGISIVSLSKLIEYLFEHHEQATLYFFLGLIIGVIPFLLHQANYKENFKGSHMVFLLVFAALVASMAFLETGEPEAWEGSLSTGQMIALFFSGWMASMAMILPGISGSFLLLLVGVYETAIQAISQLQIGRIALIGAGVAVGLLISSKAIRYLFKRFPSHTYATVIGLVIGSVFVVFPGMPGDLILCLITFIGGLLVAYLLGKVEY
ncbi:DUF368 domain-containing protein [Pontibacillus sp. ALD_SL1]|uniref:DUF368 domain-containing protein n=1 Tax=Pontibacillus sp. ALD_SL1 TaxID=2777185 RepID=UPI001A961B49|nr:DUF368 domain-containing protein [Pontibacillus sp. ALD_SL1]QST00254.1 DUF368 domain-containing protein [Pontibacillus sp. ALD_SL1]